MAIDHDTGVSMSPQPPQDGRWAMFVPASYKNMTSGEAQLPIPTIPNKDRPTRRPQPERGPRCQCAASGGGGGQCRGPREPPAWLGLDLGLGLRGYFHIF
jgi:hypothetical protein